MCTGSGSVPWCGVVQRAGAAEKSFRKAQSFRKHVQNLPVGNATRRHRQTHTHTHAPTHRGKRRTNKLTVLARRFRNTSKCNQDKVLLHRVSEPRPRSDGEGGVNDCIHVCEVQFIKEKDWVNE